MQRVDQSKLKFQKHLWFPYIASALSIIQDHRQVGAGGAQAPPNICMSACRIKHEIVLPFKQGEILLPGELIPCA